MTGPRIAFVGAGSTVFMKNIVADVLLRPALTGAHIALMDIDSERLRQSEIVARKIIDSVGAPAQLLATTDRRKALDGADFVIVAFQIGGYEPCTVTDFEIPKKYGLRQTIADTLGIGGIMRGLRTVPHLWDLCADMMELCPHALLLQHVNPMAINTWAIGARFPRIRQVGLCHSVEYTCRELAHDLDLSVDDLRYRVAGINHMAFFLELERRLDDGSWCDVYPLLRDGYRAGRIPKPNVSNPRCPNKVRYEMMMRTGYFVTESSEHFAEYVPYFIKRGREDLIERFEVPLDEYPRRCVEQVEQWRSLAARYTGPDPIEVEPSVENAAPIIDAITTGRPTTIYGNVINGGAITSLPDECAVEVPCLVDANGVQPTVVGNLPPQLTALMRTNINVQELVVAALMEENREHVFHAAMVDPHCAAELDLDQIWSMTEELIDAHGDWLPPWLHRRQHEEAAE